MDKDKYGNLVYEDSRTLKFTVLGEPKPQQRPRFSTVNGHAKAYEAKQSKNEKAAIRLIAQQAVQEQHWQVPSPDAPVAVTLKIYLPIPNSKQKWFKEASLKGYIVPLSGRGDLDNFQKIYYDAMNTICFHDDRQIFYAVTSKHYSDVPRVEVEVTKLYVNYGELKAKAMADVRAKKEGK